jgi:hypothetical protein
MQPISSTPPRPDPGAVWCLVQLAQTGPDAGSVKVTHNIAQGVTNPAATADFLEHAARRVREDAAHGRTASGIVLPAGARG